MISNTLLQVHAVCVKRRQGKQGMNMVSFWSGKRKIDIKWRRGVGFGLACVTLAVCYYQNITAKSEEVDKERSVPNHMGDRNCCTGSIRKGYQPCRRLPQPRWKAVTLWSS